MSEKHTAATIVAFQGADYLAHVRRITGCFAENLGMDADERDDAALSVNEACVKAVRHGSGNKSPNNVLVTFNTQDDALTAQVTGFGGISDLSDSSDDSSPGLGMSLMNQLCDSVDCVNRRKMLTIRLTKRARSAC